MTERFVVAGPDPVGVADRLIAAGREVNRIPERATRSRLEAAGIDGAVALILTDPADGTAIPIANELESSVRVIVYATGQVPAFARHQADLLLDPDVVPLELLIEELAGPA